jgi:hypothetical protein
MIYFSKNHPIKETIGYFFKNATVVICKKHMLWTYLPVSPPNLRLCKKVLELPLSI